MPSIMIGLPRRGGKEKEGAEPKRFCRLTPVIMNYAVDEFIQFIKRGLQKL
jgi:hypothetical protein